MAKLIDMSLNQFVNEAASDSPAPGGGSVAALVGALAAALGQMVLKLTDGKKAFKELDEDIQNQLMKKLGVLQRLQRRLESLVDEDTQAFLMFMEALKMPKETEEQKKRRKSSMAEASMKSTTVPLASAQAIMEVLENLPLIAQYGNKNAVSDVGTACYVADAALGGAHLNVRINLPGIEDENFVADTRALLQKQKDRSNELKAETIKWVEERL